MSAKKVSFRIQPPPAKATPTPDQWIEGGKESFESDKGHEEPMKRLTIDLPESLHKRVKSGCAQRGQKMADVIREWLDKEFPAS